mgnify:CR=1 FL=1
MQLKSHGDMPVPTTRVNTDITCNYWWSQCACNNRFSIVVSYKVLYRENNYEVESINALKEDVRTICLNLNPEDGLTVFRTTNPCECQLAL